MDTLLNDLKNPDADVRRAAAEGLSSSYDEEAVIALIDTLSDTNRGVSEAAENSLLSIRGKRVVKKVIPLLSSEEPNLRNFAFEILCEIGGDSIDDVIALLNDADKDLRKYAADILGELAEPVSVRPLIDSLDDKNVNVGAAAAESLGKIGNIRAIPELIKKLSGDIWMQCSVIKSLSMFDDPKANKEVYRIIPNLRGMPLFSAITALGDVGNKSAILILINLLNEKNKAFKSSIVSSMEKIINRNAEASYDTFSGKIEINELFELLHDQKIETKISTINILGWLKNESAVKPLIDEFLEAEKRIDSAKADIKQHIFAAIIKINPGDISSITETLNNISTPVEIKAELIDILGRLKKEEAVASIISMKDSTNHLIRRTIAKTLGEFDHPDSIETLKNFLKDNEGHTRGNSAVSLGKLKVESAIDDLLSVFDDEYPDNRENAAFALASIGTDRVIEKLREVSSASSSDEKRRLAILALGHIDNPLAKNILFEYLKDSDPIIRKTAIEVISEKCTGECVKQLLPMLDDEDNNIKIAAVTGLSKGDPAVITPYLLKALKENEHLKIKYHIIETLGNTKTKEATDALLELLDSESSVMVLSSIDALGKIQDEKAVEPLKRLCESDNSEISRAAHEALELINRGF